jgi:hypothetical protein
MDHCGQWDKKYKIRAQIKFKPAVQFRNPAALEHSLLLVAANLPVSTGANVLLEPVRLLN